MHWQDFRHFEQLPMVSEYDHLLVLGKASERH